MQERLIIQRTVINVNESRLGTFEQTEQFLSASNQVEFSAHGGDAERYERISLVSQRFDDPRHKKRECGVLLRYLLHTSGYSRAQVTRLVARWGGNRSTAVSLVNGYWLPYADDAVVSCRTVKDAQTALSRIRAWVSANGLQPDKTDVGDCREKGKRVRVSRVPV